MSKSDDRVDRERSAVLDARADSLVNGLIRRWNVDSERFRTMTPGRGQLALGYAAPPDAVKNDGKVKKLTSSGATIVAIGGPVVAPEVVLGGVSLHARFPEVWDVSNYPSASLGSNFTGFNLPTLDSVNELVKDDFAKKLGTTTDQLTQSTSCLIGGANRLRGAMLEVRDFAVELIAEVHTQAGLDSVVYSPLFASKDIRWAGALQYGMTVSVEAEFSGGAKETMTFDLAGDPRLIAEGDKPAVLHILMMRNGQSGLWDMVVTRSV